MSWGRRGTALAALAVGSVAPARADELPHPLQGLGEHTVRAFTGTRLLHHGAAVAATIALSPTGGDHAARVGVQEAISAPLWGDAAYYAGYALPVAVPLALYVTGLATGERSPAGAGSAAIQALGLTMVATVVLKVGTGRPFPMHGGDPEAPDRLRHPEYAREWAPFGFDGRYAWPSGHTAASVSVAAAWTAYASTSVVVPVVSYSVAVGIGAGMIVGDHHFLSDVLAGALLGQAIGWSVGSGFREREHPSERVRGAKGGLELRVVPLLGHIRGCAVVGEL